MDKSLHEGMLLGWVLIGKRHGVLAETLPPAAFRDIPCQYTVLVKELAQTPHSCLPQSFFPLLKWDYTRTHFPL